MPLSDDTRINPGPTQQTGGSTPSPSSPPSSGWRRALAITLVVAGGLIALALLAHAG